MTTGGAGTIVNAMALGRGAAFGLRYHARARLQPARSWSVHTDGRRLPGPKARLAIESARVVLGQSPQRIEVHCDIPPERGLKSSSAVSLAVLQAALRSKGSVWPTGRLLRTAATVGLRSGTSLTGAYDDAAACLLGGVVVTDNRARRILHRYELPRGLRALVHVPSGRRPTSSIRGTDFRPIRAAVDEAFRHACQARVRDAMLLNTSAYAGLFRLATRFTTAALEIGCYAAGLSGKGPAQVALGTPDALHELSRRFDNTHPIGIRRGQAA